MSNEERAEEWLEKAEKRLKAFSLFGGGSTKFEDAAEYYAKAANLFKMAKKWEQAGGAFIKAAECNLKSQSKHEAATNYINAGNCLKKVNINDAVTCLRTAVEFFTDDGRFSMAAKHQKEIAELFEQELDFEHAMENYQVAADYYEGENSTSNSNSCLLKVAQYAAQLEKYDKAIEIYEKVAKNSLDNNLLKWGVKDYFFKAVLCYLAASDLVSAKRSLDKYQDMDPTFSSQRESKFLTDIITAYEGYDVDAFTQAVVDFDSVTKLDQWKTTILLRIKNHVKSEETGLA